MDKLTKYAPIGVVTLNRDIHLKRCIHSLQKCTDANNSELYIALDYPLKDSHWEGYRKILNYIETITGFKEVHIIKREENFGALKNSLDLNEIIFKKHDRLIKTEDDNEFSPNALVYFKKGLEMFEKNDKISAICGYNGVLVPSEYSNSFYYNKNFVGWGFAWWRQSYTTLEWDYRKLEVFMSDKKNKKTLKSLFPQHYLTVRQKIKEKGRLYGDGVIPLLNIMNDTYCVYPTKSLVRNHGFDGSGVHCNKKEDADKYHNQEIDNNIEFSFISDPPVELDPSIWDAYKKQTKPSFIKKIKYQLKLNNCIAPIITFFRKK